jgi:hypothetical protein
MRISTLIGGLATTLVAAARVAAQDVWIAHITDPHVFEEPKKLWVDPWRGEKFDTTWKTQQRGNRRAFLAALRALSTLPTATIRPRALVITGDFGLDSGWWTKKPEYSQPQNRQHEIDTLAILLAASPITNVYIVPGNNDLTDETSDTIDAKRVSIMWSAVGAALTARGSPVTIHDLGLCFSSTAIHDDSCIADLTGTDLRLIAVPSYSFKDTSANRGIQTKQMQRVDSLVARASTASRRVILIEHIPELDDPYLLGFSRSDSLVPPPVRGKPIWAPLSAWNVPSAMFTEWRGISNSATVIAVLAGHFHDSHREVYQQPYSWAGTSADRASLSKLFIAPPIAVKKQDTSPIQARGFALLRIGRDSVDRTIYWLERTDTTYVPERHATAQKAAPEATSIPWGLRWLWKLGGSASAAVRATIWAISFLLAFLTAVAVWRIRPATKPGAGTSAEGKTEGKSDDSVLKTNLAQIVISGLLGFAGITLIDQAFWSNAEKGGAFSAKAYYLICFVAFFFALLFLSGAFRGIVEAVRASLSIVDRRPSREKKVSLNSVARGLTNQASRIVRVWALTWADTFFNVIRGENDLQSKVWSDEIRATQASIVAAMQQIRASIEVTVNRALHAKSAPGLQNARVNISVRSLDGTQLFYVAKAPESLGQPFSADSIAGVAVERHVALWWKQSFMPVSDRIVIFVDDDKKKDDKSRDLFLADHYSVRPAPDYEAFLVIPIPWYRSGYTERRGCIHISFREEIQLDQVIEHLQPDDPAVKELGRAGKANALRLNSDKTKGMLEETLPANHAGDPHVHDKVVGAVLRQSVEVLRELLGQFNEDVFKAEGARSGD